ncbi:hypothetical protein PVAR5_8992 [Paecilomyces variotii No. 5]|uniref:Uncharacterized protein n=1 Tax=Byssochlamys spectabilis (strain No. 5 / NBRC 109023) TaxID=1356009 RepID=V5GH23_BYSSN|nr:hypothetical protein PVAR5_8992 [Paecilomyces variotii No. 5]
MTGTLKKAFSFILLPKGRQHLDRTQGNNQNKASRGHRVDKTTGKIKGGQYGTERRRMQRGAPALPTITGCSPQFYAPNPLPEAIGKKGLLSKSRKIWKTVLKRVVKLRNPKYVKKFKHTWGKDESRGKVFRFREFNRGSRVHPSLAYDEVSRVVRRKGKRVRHVKRSPATPVTQQPTSPEPILPSKPLPFLPPDADPVEDIRAAIRTPFASKLTPPRRVFPRQSRIKEHWLALSSQEPGPSVHTKREHSSTEENNCFPTPVPSITRTHSTISSSLFLFYERELSILEDSRTFDNRLQGSPSTVSLGNLSQDYIDTALDASHSDSGNPFYNHHTTKDTVLSAQKHMKHSSNLSEHLSQEPLGNLRKDGSLGAVQSSCRTEFSRNQTESVLSIHSDIDTTRTKTRLSPSPSLSPSVQSSNFLTDLPGRPSVHRLRRTTALAGDLRSQYMSANKAMLDAYPLRTKKPLGQISPYAPASPDLEAIGHTLFSENENTDRGLMSPTAEESHGSPAPISSAPSRVSSQRDMYMAHSRIPIATGSDLLSSPIRYDRSIIQRMNVASKNRSSTQATTRVINNTTDNSDLEGTSPANAGSSPNLDTVGIAHSNISECEDVECQTSKIEGSLRSSLLNNENPTSRALHVNNLPNSPLSENNDALQSIRSRSNNNDRLASPIPRYEDSPLPLPLLPPPAASSVTPNAEDDGNVYMSDGQPFVRPQGIYTGEYRERLSSRMRLDLGPTMQISRSADKLIMGPGEEEEASPNNPTPRPTQCSLGEGIRASIGSRFSMINLKNAINGTEDDPKGKARPEVKMSSPTGTPRSKRSPAKTLKREFSAKEMHLFHRFGSRTSLSSLTSTGSQMCIPEDAPPVPAVPAEYRSAAKGTSRPGNGEPSGAAGRSLAAMPSFDTLVAMGKRDFRDRALHSHPVDLEEVRAMRDSAFPPRTSSLQALGGNGATAIRGFPRMRTADSVPEFSERGAVQAQPATSRRSGVLRSVLGFFTKPKAKEGKTSQASGWRGLKRASKAQPRASRSRRREIS